MIIVMIIVIDNSGDYFADILDAEYDDESESESEIAFSYQVQITNLTNVSHL